MCVFWVTETSLIIWNVKTTFRFGLPNLNFTVSVWFFFLRMYFILFFFKYVSIISRKFKRGANRRSDHQLRIATSNIFCLPHTTHHSVPTYMLCISSAHVGYAVWIIIRVFFTIIYKIPWMWIEFSPDHWARPEQRQYEDISCERNMSTTCMISIYQE